MQSSYRCLQSFLAALNGAQSSVCCHCSGTQPSIRTTMTVNYPWLTRCGVYLLYISTVMIIYAIIRRDGEIRSDFSPKGSIWYLRLTAAG